MVGIRYAFSNPFNRNHCVVLAWTHLAGGDQTTALQLADKARRAGKLSRGGKATGRAFAWWAEQLGLRVLQSASLVRVPRHLWNQRNIGYVRERGYAPVTQLQTLETFAQQHPRGRYLVLVRGHAVAVIDGQIFGSWRPRSRVQFYAEVTK